MSGFVLRRLHPHASAILRSYAAGTSYEELAERYACAWQTIRRFLLSQDVELRPVPRSRKLDAHRREVIDAYKAGADITAIAARFCVQPQTVRNFVLDRKRA